MVDAKGASLGVKPKARSLHLSGCAVKNSNAPNRPGRASSCCLLGRLELRAAAIGPNVQSLLKRPQSEDAILQSDSMSTGHVAPWFLPLCVSTPTFSLKGLAGAWLLLGPLCTLSTPSGETSCSSSLRIFRL